VGFTDLMFSYDAGLGTTTTSIYTGGVATSITALAGTGVEFNYNSSASTGSLPQHLVGFSGLGTYYADKMFVGLSGAGHRGYYFSHYDDDSSNQAGLFEWVGSNNQGEVLGQLNHPLGYSATGFAEVYVRCSGSLGVDADCDGIATAQDCDDDDPTLGAIANDPDCDGVVDCLGLDASTPASSCENALAICSNLSDDNYWLSPQGGTPFQAYCDMSTSGGGWTMVANISDAGSDVWSQFMPSQDAGLWDSISILGSTPTFTDDYKSQAYMDITATSLLIKEAGTNAVLRADNCWTSSSFQGFISGLLWDGDASDSNWSDGSGAALCNFEHYGYNDPVLRASSHSGTQRVLAFKWGERNGVQDQNKDRAMITTYLANGYSTPHHIDFPTGLGGFTAYHANQNFEDANECQAEGPNFCTNGTQNYQLFVR